ncbi:MAG: hypothetical protein K6C12_05875 [Oscillospiraceae bacterium]|nr:hypothetical protein [Oscillospiraceae bacterium]
MENSNGLFREQSLERITSPEQLSDYLHVTNPTVWLILTAVIVLLAGALIWSSTANIESRAMGTATVADGSMTLIFEDEKVAAKVEPGMNIVVGETESRINSVGKGEDGQSFAVAETALASGSYEAFVPYSQTKVLQLLFN